MVETILDLLAFAWGMMTLLASNMQTILDTGFGYGKIPTPSDYIAGTMHAMGEERWNAMGEIMQWLTGRLS